MAVRRNLIAIAVLAITGTTAAGGAAYAAGSGTTPNSKQPAACPGKPGSPIKDKDQDQRIAAAAKDLGVTAAKLTDALTATKVWLGTTQTKPTAAAVAGHVASLLGLPADRVERVLVADGIISDGPEGPGKGSPDKDKGDAQNTHIAAAAKDLGITAAKLTDALTATKVWAGTSGTERTPEAFTAHVASLLGLPAARVQHALDANKVFSSTPKKPSDSKGPVCDGPGDKQQAQEIATAAHEIGVTSAQLTDALVATKVWLGSTTQTKPTPQAFAGHVASLLGKPSDKVLNALVSAGVLALGDSKDKNAVVTK